MTITELRDYLNIYILEGYGDVAAKTWVFNPVTGDYMLEDLRIEDVNYEEVLFS